MADSRSPEVRAVVPRNMRPRSTPNAEINAQTRDSVLREMSGEAAPEVKDVPRRGYCKGGKVISSRNV